MAVKTWPTGVLIESVDIQPVNPSQVIHRIVNANSVQIFDYGYGTWIGQIVISERSDGAIVESFLADLNGGFHTVDMPIHRKTISGDAVAITAVASGAYTLASAPTGLEVGCYIRSGNRSFVVTEVGTGNTPAIRLWPYYPLTTSSTISSGANMRVRARGIPTMPRNRDYYGQWTFRWEEAGQ